MLKKEGKRLDEEECERYAEEKLQERIDTIRAEMEAIENGRLDACIAVSHGMSLLQRFASQTYLISVLIDDDESIAELSETTSHCFDNDRLRLLYVRAQVTRIGTYTFVYRRFCEVKICFIQTVNFALERHSEHAHFLAFTHKLTHLFTRSQNRAGAG